ncbi:hypothetical protein [Solimonas sp. K1W22B-7]|uniref:hypothetical protein n=1 Tax=Solimonas sp. K1W22B-7 TaxID=2303331 RepID=UPI0013C51056|nr:hypothetical protein [Solimonas sp. K1W22B-7]
MRSPAPGADGAAGVVTAGDRVDPSAAARAAGFGAERGARTGGFEDGGREEDGLEDDGFENDDFEAGRAEDGRDADRADDFSEVLESDERDEDFENVEEVLDDGLRGALGGVFNGGSVRRKLRWAARRPEHPALRHPRRHL